MRSFPAVLSLALSIIIGFVLDVDQFLYGLLSMRFPGNFCMISE